MSIKKRRPWYYAAIFTIVMAVVTWPNKIPVIIFGIPALLCITEIIAAGCKICRINKNKEIEE